MKHAAGDLLVLQGSPRDLEVLEGLQALTIEEQTPSLVAELESQQVGVTEVLLSPRTTLAGRTLADLLFRDHYGISVLAIWRKGRPTAPGSRTCPCSSETPCWCTASAATWKPWPGTATSSYSTKPPQRRHAWKRPIRRGHHAGGAA
jgi:hypothetical protein